MQMHRALSNISSSFTNLNFRAGSGPCSRSCITTNMHVNHICQRNRLFIFHKHIYHTMLQSLKAPNRHAKLVTGFTIFNSSQMRFMHSTNRFTTNRGNAIIQSFFKKRQSGIQCPQKSFSTKLNIFKTNISGATAINCLIILRRNAIGRFINDKETDTVLLPPFT